MNVVEEEEVEVSQQKQPRKRPKILAYILEEHISKRNLSISTGALIGLSPLVAIIGNCSGFSREEVAGQVGTNVFLFYCGLGNMIEAYRRGWKSLFRIKEESSKVVRLINDSFAGATFNPVFAPLSYGLIGIAYGTFNAEHVERATRLSVYRGALAGWAVGAGIDMYRELIGEKQGKYLPEIIRRRQESTKRKIATGVLAGSMALTSLIVLNNRNPDVPRKADNPVIQEYIDDNNYLNQPV